MHMCALIGLPAMTAFNEITAAFPGEETLWEAPDAQAWTKLYASNGQKPKMFFAKSVKVALSTPKFILPLTDWTSSLLGFTLYRWVVSLTPLEPAH